MADSTYKVKRGDTLSEIAQKYKNEYGFTNTYDYVNELVKINDITDPNYIVVGQIIKLTGKATTITNTTSTAVIKAFGLQSNTDRTMYATWTWSKSNTENYQVIWYYDTGNGVWFVGSDSTTTYKQSLYTAPANAAKVKFKVKPISKKRTVNNKETTYWTASWSVNKTYSFSDNPPMLPSVPSVTITDLTLTTTLTNIESIAKIIQFEVVKDDFTVIKKEKVAVKTASATYTCAVAAGGRYKVRCRAYANGDYSDWTAYSNNVETIPAVPGTFTTCRVENEVNDKIDVYLEWAAVPNVTSYDIEYTTEKSYFDGSNGTTTVNTSTPVVKFTVTGLEKGKEYFFRLRAVNNVGSSGWSEIKSTVTGTSPAAPTTWSLTTTAVKGEDIYLYWNHNAEDGSKQTFAQLKIQIGSAPSKIYTMQNSKNEINLDDAANNVKGSYQVADTSGYCRLETTNYDEGVKIRWCVRTSGVKAEDYSEWSVERVVDVYAQPSLELKVTDLNNQMLGVEVCYKVEHDPVTDIYTVMPDIINDITGVQIPNAFTTTGEAVFSGTLPDGTVTYYCESTTKLNYFPFNISALAGPNTQRPTGYHLSIISNEFYETVDNVGNLKIVNIGDQVYSKHFDISEKLEVVITPGDISLENNISYTVNCTVSMDSGLTGDASWEFEVAWANYIQYDPNAEIGINDDNFSAWIRPYCEDIDGNIINGILLSVYRREFDGSFTELATNIINSDNTFITDPHPSLDYARYRIVATVTDTGAISYYDVPAHPVNAKTVIIQWDEEWSTFEASSVNPANTSTQPPWSGSLLKLPYNVDVSDKHSSDSALIAYIGRKRPVAYYGTQLGETSTWNVVIDKNDKETLYGLRRLAIWMGDVYVREPSGSGYWANIKVSFSQKHREPTIPVTIEVTRVEGGV